MSEFCIRFGRPTINQRTPRNWSYHLLPALVVHRNDTGEQPRFILFLAFLEWSWAIIIITYYADEDE